MFLEILDLASGHGWVVHERQLRREYKSLTRHRQGFVFGGVPYQHVRCYHICKLQCNRRWILKPPLMKVTRDLGT